MQGKSIDLVAGARVDFGHDRIVAGDEAVGVAREALDGLPASDHVADVVDDRKRAPSDARTTGPRAVSTLTPCRPSEWPPTRCTVRPGATSPSPEWKVTRSP